MIKKTNHTETTVCDLCKEPVHGSVRFDRVMRSTLDADYLPSTDYKHHGHRHCLVDYALTQLGWK
jgi:hypothetical protein